MRGHRGIKNRVFQQPAKAVSILPFKEPGWRVIHESVVRAFAVSMNRATSVWIKVARISCSGNTHADGS
jgi:hypothetical protein